ncbi:MAG: sugar-binding domain-containing protein [Acidobacteriaceae bacterium]
MSSFTRLTRRRFLALSGAVAAQAAVPASALHAAPTPPTPARAGTQSLAGLWRFSLDRTDTGVKESWFSRELPEADHITLPGILQTQGYGDDITAETQFVAALPRDMAWYKLPQYAAYTKPDHVEVPYLSQPVKHYLGVAWYQREIDIPAGWRGKRVGLTLERTRWQTNVYLDEKEIGSCHSLVAPHEYDLGVLAPGRHRLSIRIDNRMILVYRPDGHSVSDAEGSTWNGIVGRIELAATSPVWIDDAQVFPNVGDKTAQIKVRIGNATGNSGSGTLTVGATTAPVNWDATGGDATIDVPLPKAVPWSEFTPVLQHLTLKLSGPSADDHRDLTFGLREMRADGKHILLNGELFNFRATHDGGGFPLNGYPATDVATWKRIIGICKTWGLNGMRFHSWCPPEAAFTAADELGFYLQPECGMWNSFDADGKMLAILNDETARLRKAYGNHPSLVLLNATNEPAGHYSEQLPLWDKKWHDADPRRLYSDGTGRFAPPPGGPGTPYAADFLVTPGARGPHGWFGADYEQVLQSMLHDTSIPCIGHEVGQWCAYPDFDVIKKFSGQATTFAGAPEQVKEPYMIPGNYRIWRDSAEAHGLVAKNKELAHASGRFQVACYKEEIEASLRTPSYSGYELLDLHDYLGQGGALIGLLDAFWEPKSYATPAEFRQYCNATVPLARLKERVYTTADTLKADVELAHFGSAPLIGAKPQWQIVSAAGKIVASGSWPARAVPRGKNIALGSISADLSQLAAPARYTLVVELQGVSNFRNEWNFWLYPAKVDDSHPRDVVVTTSWPQAETHLATGGKVLFHPLAADLDSTNPKLSTVPIFWNHLMNPNGTTFLGLWNDANHPALAGFPTESNCDWQWIDLAGDARALNLDALPAALQPIVQPIDDWNRNWKLGLLYECSVGSGKLLVCSIDLTTARKGAPSLRQSILDYMASEAFHPKVEIAVADLRKQWVSQRPNSVDPSANQPVQPTSPDLVDPGQIRRTSPAQ